MELHEMTNGSRNTVLSPGLWMPSPASGGSDWGPRLRGGWIAALQRETAVPLLSLEPSTNPGVWGTPGEFRSTGYRFLPPQPHNFFADCVCLHWDTWNSNLIMYCLFWIIAWSSLEHGKKLQHLINYLTGKALQVCLEQGEDFVGPMALSQFPVYTRLPGTQQEFVQDKE